MPDQGSTCSGFIAAMTEAYYITISLVVLTSNESYGEENKPVSGIERVFPGNVLICLKLKKV